MPEPSPTKDLTIVPLDPALTERLPLLDGFTSWSQTTEPGFAERFARWAQDPQPYPRPEVPTREVALAADGHPFRVRVYGSGDGSAPALVWVHGGGFLAGGLDMNEADLVAREVAVRAGAVVVSVDYGLVPAVTFPVPHRQVVAAVRWTLEQATDLGLSRDRLVLGGASAGAALALAAARDLPADGGPLLRALVLAYPVAHRAWPVDPEQEIRMAGLPRLLRFTPPDIAGMNEDYLADHPDPCLAFVDQDPAGPTSALTGLPPMLVLVDEYDDLRTSAELLVRQAQEAGVPVERRLCEGMVHGHLEPHAGPGRGRCEPGCDRAGGPRRRAGRGGPGGVRTRGRRMMGPLL